MMITIITILKYAVIIIISLYAFCKLTKIKLQLANLLDIVVALFLSSGLYYITKSLRVLIPIGLLAIVSFYQFFRYRQPIHKTLVVSAISLGIAICIMTCAFFLDIPFGLIIYHLIANPVIKEIVKFVIFIGLQILLAFLLFKIKRFKGGISFYNGEYIELLLLASALCIFLMTLFYTENATNSPIEFVLIILIFCSLIFIIWLRKHITSNYRRQIYNRNEALYEQRIESYAKEVQELKTQNESLAKIIHRDNKLISAMCIAVKEISSGNGNIDEASKLLAQLEELYAEHQELINNYHHSTENLPKIDDIALDAVIHFLYNKATQNHIETNIKLNKEAIPALLSEINTIDLSTILCDIGENAIIATKTVSEQKRNILIAFDLDDNDVPFISVYDNGPYFDVNVIKQLGERRITTHKADGGSGFGLLTLFAILQKYNASFILNETLNEKDYTKYIRVIFDGLGEKKVIRNSVTSSVE